MRLPLLICLFLPVSVMAQGDLRGQKEEVRLLFKKGHDVGRVGDKPTGAYRRIVQRTIMPSEPTPWYGAVLTFDDQLVPMETGDSSAMDIVKDLQKCQARAIFFANVPGLSSKSLYPIYRATSDLEKRKEKCRALLNKQKPIFIKTLRALLKVKQDGQYVCDVFNHTAFHQDMHRFKVGSRQMEMCIIGIRFIEECLDEAYKAERPDFERPRYFRFPFLHVPRDAKAREALNALFIELGLIALGETQDSKDFDNKSPTRAMASIKAAQSNKRYSVKSGAYGQTDQPIALFHTKTWSKIKPGVLKIIKATPKPPPLPPAPAFVNQDPEIKDAIPVDPSKLLPGPPPSPKPEETTVPAIPITEE